MTFLDYPYITLHLSVVTSAEMDFLFSVRFCNSQGCPTDSEVQIQWHLLYFWSKKWGLTCPISGLSSISFLGVRYPQGIQTPHGLIQTEWSGITLTSSPKPQSSAPCRLAEQSPATEISWALVRAGGSRGRLGWWALGRQAQKGSGQCISSSCDRSSLSRSFHRVRNEDVLGEESFFF